jgi:hypothetical protein
MSLWHNEEGFVLKLKPIYNKVLKPIFLSFFFRTKIITLEQPLELQVDALAFEPKPFKAQASKVL